MTAARLLRSARRGAHLSQCELSEASDVAEATLSRIENARRQPSVDLLERLLSHTQHSIVLVPTIRKDAATIGAVISDALNRDDVRTAYRQLIQLADNLADVHSALRVGLTLAEPPPFADPGWGAALAAVAAYRLDEEGLPRAEWIDDASRFLPAPWQPPTGTVRTRVDATRVPAEFARRNVLIEAETLVSA
ncbi:Cro/Cl family transcriptional regulator [Rathayibacter rathayi]|uniref:helix-turn-helix domain-containing protein n=1 Tax=Rathayibacter rathayi TaxID=33887 RepID=UPI000CE927D3|nr:helix-turn-helix transcriptional regulator [Rathayibacter rathayi]PPG86497.1 Cro/Cl family transcriptional regulator [Rathayibacter rathayi]PPG97958.1 Cro/Cl family transcriptional regulator [Rathayibacter rathayi]